MVAASRFRDNVASFNSAVDGAISALGTVRDSMNDANDLVYSPLSKGKEPMGYVTIVITAVFGVLIGFSVFGILGALMMTFCEKTSCRYLVYFTCAFLFLLGIIAFLLAVLFSIFTPVLYYGCDFLQFSVESGDNFAGT